MDKLKNREFHLFQFEWAEGVQSNWTCIEKERKEKQRPKPKLNSTKWQISTSIRVHSIIRLFIRPTNIVSTIHPTSIHPTYIHSLLTILQFFSTSLLSVAVPLFRIWVYYCTTIQHFGFVVVVVVVVVTSKKTFRILVLCDRMDNTLLVTKQAQNLQNGTAKIKQKIKCIYFVYFQYDWSSIEPQLWGCEAHASILY